MKLVESWFERLLILDSYEAQDTRNTDRDQLLLEGSP